MKLNLFLLIVLFVSHSYSQKNFDIYNDDGYMSFINDVIEENPNKGIFLLDSLQNHIIESNKKPYALMKNFYKISAYRILGNFELVFYHAEEAKKIAIANDYETYIPEIHREMGDEYMDQNLYEKAKLSYDNAIKWYKKQGNEEGVITCTYEGFIENKQGKFRESNILLKKLLPVFKQAHPVYLDALSTIADNYMELDIIDSAFIYVNKMPLETVEDHNNLNYSLHKYHVSFLYHLQKRNIDEAILFNQKIGNYRMSSEIEIHYFKNALEIAKQQKDSEKIIQYSDSLESMYKKRVDEVKKQDVYTSEKALNINNKLLKTQEEVTKQKWYLILSIIGLSVISILISLFFIKKRKRQEKVILKMKSELEKLTENLNLTPEENATNDSFETKIKNISKKYNLSDRESDILQHIVQGYKNTEIAEKLFISVNTVKYHIKNLYEKLEVQKRAEISSKIIFNK